MNDVHDATTALLDEKPGVEATLREMLALDESGAWTFDDLPCDSGTFGEIVARGIAEEADDGYRVADTEAVRAALDAPEATPTETETGGSVDAVAWPSVDRRELAVLAVAVAVVVLVRVVTTYPSVIRGGDVVLSGNDPYFYRYWGETLLRSELAAFDPAVLGDLPGVVPRSDVLLIVGVWWAASLLGADAAAVGSVLAWYPVAAAALTAVPLYFVARHASGDRRVPVLAVLFLGLMPVHAFRTSLGFGDHHALDYLLLATVLWCLVALPRGIRPRRAGARDWLAVAGLGVAVAVQVLAWRGGPLLLVPVGVFLAVWVPLQLPDDRDLVAAAWPVVAGLAAAAVLVFATHVGFGWLRTERALAPALLAAGSAVLLGAGVVLDRFDLSPRYAVAAEAGTGLVVVVVAYLTVTPFARAVGRLGGYLIRTDRANIAETASLFGGQLGTVVGPVFLFGFLLFLALPYLAWATVRGWRDRRGPLLVLAAYGWFFLVLSAVQSRFAGHLAVVTAVFAAVGFLHLAARVDVTVADGLLDRSPTGSADTTPWRRPSWGDVGNWSVLFLLVVGVSLVQIPVKTGQVTVTDERYRTAQWVDEHADDAGLTYPENYVFSQWGRNRVDNYFVSGNSRSYAYAQDNYGRFVRSSNPAAWFDRLRAADRAGYIYVPRGGTGGDSLRSILGDRYGQWDVAPSGVGHYRLIHTTDARRVYHVVPGLRVTGAGEPGSTVAFTTETTVDGQQRTFDLRAPVNEFGVYEATLPYAGTYDGPNGTVSATERTVRSGGLQALFPRPGVAAWSFDEGRGDRAYDRAGGHHLPVDPRLWTSTADGAALRFDGADDRIRHRPDDGFSVGENESLTVSLRFRGDLSTASTTFPHVFGVYGENASYRVYGNRDAPHFGAKVTDDDGDAVEQLDVPTATFEGWTNLTVSLDRSVDEVRLYRNGTVVSRSDASDIGAITVDEVIVGGDRFEKYAPVTVDSIRITNRPATDRE